MHHFLRVRFWVKVKGSGLGFGLGLGLGLRFSVWG